MSGVDAHRLLVRSAPSLADLPADVELPAALAGDESIIVNYQAWERRGPDFVRLGQHTEVVLRDQPDGRLQLRSAEVFRSEAPVKVVVTGFVAPARRQALSARIEVPEDGVLRVGYGLREESWVPGGAAGRFHVSVVESAGTSTRLFSRDLDPRTQDDRRWFDQTIDLGRFAGRRVTLRFGVDALDDGEIFLPVWADPVVAARRRPDRPNVILLSLDTLRARSLGGYGYARATSPFIDSVAQAGTLFERAMTTSATTGPSHMSLFTGLYPPNHGIRRGIEKKKADATTLAETLRAAGYETVAFTEDGYIVRDNGFGDGFSDYTEFSRERAGEPQGEAKLTFASAERWLSTQPQQPFFLFVHTYQVHSPYDPPAPYDGLFPEPVDDDDVKPEFRRLRDDYDREIRMVDDAVRTLFAALHQADLETSTIVVILADHGEEFGEHGSLHHGTAVFDEVLHIPMIFWGPGRIPAGRRSATPVSLVDVMPTVLDLAGIALPPVAGGPHGSDGLSLRSVIQEDGVVADRTVFGEAHAGWRWTGPSFPGRFNPPVVAALSGRTKFVVHRPQEGEVMPPVAYDLAEDPRERRPRPIADADLTLVNRLVDAYLQGATDGQPAPPEAGEGEAGDLAPEVREKLRRLGYLE